MKAAQTLLCCAMPFGYGPAAKLLSLAPLLRRHWRLVFVGPGVAWELVSRCVELFDRVVEAQADQPIAERLVGESGAVLSVMNREFAALARRMEKLHYVVDSLLWMRQCVPAELRGAAIYFAQNFAAPPPLPDDDGPRPILVGPIVPPGRPRPVTRRSELLINLGGSEATGWHDDHYRAYGGFVLEAILASRLINAFDRQATVLGGARCVTSLEREFGTRGFEFASLSPLKAGARMREASLVLTAPGLTNTLECFSQGVRTVLLPAQNYSQACVLDHLAKAGLAPEAFTWNVASPELRVTPRLPEAARNELAIEAVKRMTSDRAAGRELTARLDSILEIKWPARLRLQSRFFRSLGTNGAVAIARQLRTAETKTAAVERRGERSRSPAGQVAAPTSY